MIKGVHYSIIGATEKPLKFLSARPALKIVSDDFSDGFRNATFRSNGQNLMSASICHVQLCVHVQFVALRI